MIKDLAKRLLNIPLFNYLLNSVIVTVIDVALVWLLYRVLHIHVVVSNTIGVVTGFILHYILTVKSVFKSKYDMVSFIVYLGTFLLGLFLADWLIYIGENELFVKAGENVRFLLSKGISVALPFFVMYFIRRFIFSLINKKR
ncbi:MAG TPA: GtrA family protein [Clostridia bacterium]|jgi:putative flippase GtrA